MKIFVFTSFFLTLLVLLGCKVQQKAEMSQSKEIFKKEGVAIFSPILNATYYFPFKDNLTKTYSLDGLMKHEYDTGFTISWDQSKWRDDILNNHSIQLPDNLTYKYVAYVTVEYYLLKTFPRDSIYTLELEYSGNKKHFVYDDKDRRFTNIKALNK